MIIDTSGLLAALDVAAKQYYPARAAIENSTEPLILSPFVLAELDYLVTSRFGAKAMRPVLWDVAHGAYQLAPIEPSDVAAAQEVHERYADLNLGLTDASLVVLAARHQTTTILTLDERHFRAIRPLWGDAFRLAPADL